MFHCLEVSPSVILFLSKSISTDMGKLPNIFLLRSLRLYLKLFIYPF